VKLKLQSLHAADSTGLLTLQFSDATTQNAAGMVHGGSGSSLTLRLTQPDADAFKVGRTYDMTLAAVPEPEVVAS